MAKLVVNWHIGSGARHSVGTRPGTNVEATSMMASHITAQVDDMVVVMDEALRAEACGVATQLRGRGRRVDLVLQAKKMKWVFKQAERCVLSPKNNCNSHNQLQLQPVTTTQLRYETGCAVGAATCHNAHCFGDVHAL